MMSELMQNKKEAEKKVKPTKLVKDTDGNYKVKDPQAVVAKKSCDCCCASHCKLSIHSLNGHLLGVNLAIKAEPGRSNEELEFPHVYEKDLFDDESDNGPIRSSLTVDRKDEIYEMLTALETDFSLV